LFLWRASSVLLTGLLALAMVFAPGCGGASSNSSGADEGGTSSHRRARDLEGCPDGCFTNEGRCLTVPEGEPEELRGDEVPIIEPIPCEPRCCEGS
jgi:hypothetical protein